MRLQGMTMAQFGVLLVLDREEDGALPLKTLELSGGLIYGCRYREQAGIKEFRGRLRRSGGTADKSDAPPGNGEGLLPGGGAEYQADGGKAGDSLKET